MARRMVSGPDNTCRWQALIVIGELIESEPEAVWRVVHVYGGSVDSDMRAGITTVLLEYLLERHFERYFPRVRERILQGDARFRRMVTMCWPLGRTQGKWRRIARLLAGPQ